MTGRSRPPSHQQSSVETIRVPGQDRLVLVDTPTLTGSVDDEPPELDIIAEWLKMVYALFFSCLYLYLIVLDRDTVGGIRLTGVIYMFSGHSSKSLVNPSILLQAFQRVTGNVTLVVNTRDVELETPVWIEKEREIKQQFLTLEPLDLPLYQCFDDLPSARKITNRFMQDDQVDVRLVLDKTWSGFSFAYVKDGWWIIKRRTARNAIYEGGDSLDPTLSTTTQRAKDGIMDWIAGKTSADAHILWLYGEAETGKSTLARALMDSCHSKNLLLATFFFSRLNASRKTIDTLVATIVDQIGNASPLARELITDAMEDHGVFWAPFAAQLNRLVLEPLLKLGVSKFPQLIIIDGLDECTPQDMQSEVVEGIIKSRQTLINTEYPLRFVIFSRPNKYLRNTFALVPNSMVHRVMMSGLEWFRFGDFSAPRAIHSSKERYDPPKCHPNTRVAVRDRLMEWATQKAVTVKDSHILWFYGGPGTGKSAIAQTVAETLQSQNLLLATFFFSRTDSTRNTINPLATTLAFQIGTVVPDLQELILKALDINPRLLNEPFGAQLRNLVLRPLADFTKGNDSVHVPQVIILDGLDECFDPEMQCQIIIGLAGVAKSGEYPVRILIVSRPEDHLEDVLNTRIPCSIVHRLALDGSCISDDDIRLFLQDKLDAIKQANPKRDCFDEDWPNPTVVEQLVRRSHGQFIHASVIVKYISSSDDPYGRLDKLLGLRCRPEDEGMLSAELDLLYLHILSSVKDIGATKMILGVILSVDPDYDFFAPLVSNQPSAAQTLSGVELLADLIPGQAASHISELHPMIQYNDNDGNIFISHATVAEFFHDHNRSKSFHLDKGHILRVLFDRCSQIIRNGTQLLFILYQWKYLILPL